MSPHCGFIVVFRFFFHDPFDFGSKNRSEGRLEGGKYSFLAKNERERFIDKRSTLSNVLEPWVGIRSGSRAYVRLVYISLRRHALGHPFQCYFRTVRCLRGPSCVFLNPRDNTSLARSSWYFHIFGLFLTGESQARQDRNRKRFTC